ncbi:hypothetical protein AXK61_21690 [Tsukamurella pseudospumae]|uniref:Penicillin-binding protein transpeptidase domain-containing protein n=1 Tax=Tsukamurella pseudospumae TaxID=239498 RepID=A0A137ZI11_9ACTN|nr:hypothetical protein AXK61_21690 [Tsukamurella pseudospumae]
MFIVAIGIVLSAIGAARTAGTESPYASRRSWILGICSLGYLAVLAIVDSGPFLITSVGLVIVADAAFGGRAILVKAGRWLRRPIGAVATLVSAVVIVVGASRIDDLTTRIPGRILSLFAPNKQMAAGFEAMQHGGLIGSGIDTSPFARGVPVGESDLLPMVFAADAGSAVMAAVGVLLVGVLGVAAIRPLFRDGPWGVIGAAVGVMVLIQAAWALLANVGIVPLTGLGVPLLVVMFSALTSSAFAVGVCLGLAPGPDAVVQPLVGGRARLARTVTALRRATQVVVVAASLVLALVVPPVANATQIYMPRGQIRTLDGAVIAGTGTDGRRTYPGGRLYTEMGLVHRGGVQYAVEDAAAAQLTCGGAPSVADRILVVVRPLPCSRADVVTSIDSRVQGAAARALDGVEGAATVIDAQTGRVHALYATTDVVPDDFRGKPLAALPPRMAARQDQAALGSVFKIITAAAALIDGVDMSGAPPFEFIADGEVLRNSGDFTCPSTRIVDMLAFSCNTTAAFAGVRVGQSRMDEVARTYFGAGETIPSDIGEFAVSGIDPGTGRGALDAAQLGRTAIGQEGSRGNVLAMAVATGIVIRAVTGGPGGGMPAPRIIDGYCRGVGAFEARTFGSTVGTRPLPSGVADTILAGMRRAVSDGTARGLKADGRTVAAKTGTAEKPNEQSINSWVTIVVDRRWVITTMVHADPASASAIRVANGILGALPKEFPPARCG